MATKQGMRSFLLSFRKWGGNMWKNILLAHANLRKSKGQTTAIIVLIFLAALMLNLWLMLSTDYKQNFDRCHDRLNDGHVTLAVDGDREEMKEFFAQTMDGDERVAEFSLDDALQMIGMFNYNSGEINTNLIILEKQTALSRPVGKVEIIEDSDIESGIYMPVLYKSDDMDIGNTIKITIGSNEMEYEVCGFFNSAMMGSHNCAMCGLLLTEDKYKELENVGYAMESTLCSVRLTDKSESEDYETMLKDAVSSCRPAAYATSNSYTIVAQGRYVSQMICSGIMSAMAFLILLISIVMIMSNIVNYIGENMQNLGALKAVGYKSRQLISSLMMQFLGISLIAAAVGAGVSYFLFPFINTMMVSQTGIPYQVRFLPIPLIITLAILGGAVVLAVWTSSGRIKKIEPIVALRCGVRTHNFKRNHVPLEDAKTPLNLALAFKTTLSGMKHNIIICITMFMISLIVVFSGLMYENVIVNMEPFLDLVVGETADSCISVNAGFENEFLQSLNDDKRVEKVYLYHIETINHAGGLELVAIICDDFRGINNQNIVIEGRFPRFDNEIAIAAMYAKKNNLKIGEEITITTGGNEADYIITGFNQISNNLGKDCLLTRAGFERIGKLQRATYYLKLTDSVDIDEFNAEIEEQFAENVNATMNIKSMIESVSAVYVMLMTVIVVAILALSAIVIVFVLYLLVRTMLGNKRRDYGILKAVGFTTGQLILQTAFSFMPAVILSTVAGLIICSFLINPLMAVFLSGIGIVKCMLTVPVGFIAVAGAVLILFTFAITCLLSLKIRKIAPRTLLVGE